MGAVRASSIDFEAHPKPKNPSFYQGTLSCWIDEYKRTGTIRGLVLLALRTGDSARLSIYLYMLLYSHGRSVRKLC